MTAPKVPVLSREDALAVMEYGAARVKELMTLAIVVGDNNPEAPRLRFEAHGISKFINAIGSAALANAARKGE